jgi:hypothetical protein
MPWQNGQGIAGIIMSEKISNLIKTMLW